MVPFGLNPNKLAIALRVAPPNIYEIAGRSAGFPASGFAVGSVLPDYSGILDQSAGAL